MRTQRGKPGLALYTVKGWDYPALVRTFSEAAARTRALHEPALIHVTELTQPQGHSTSGSHERYKPPERLEWEKAHDGLKLFRAWLLENGIASKRSWPRLKNGPSGGSGCPASRMGSVRAAYPGMACRGFTPHASPPRKSRLGKAQTPYLSRKSPRLFSLLRRYRKEAALEPLRRLYKEKYAELEKRYDTWLYRGTALQVAPVPPRYPAQPEWVEGFRILNACFRAALARDPRVVIFGEDVGRLGDVNQGCAGLQAEFGPLRVADTGIREATIIGQGIGLALRGLRPIAEVQYLDYLLYAVQILSDDVATLSWRTVGQQKVPLIVRTRGHRLEGIWHSGSPMQLLLGALRGMYLLVPRNMTQAAGLYNTLLAADEPAVLIEVLTGIAFVNPRPKMRATFASGQPEVLREGTDVTLLTYGATCRIALEAAQDLEELGVSCEVVDAQTLLPFDVHGVVGQSLRKTGRLVVVDEDVSGGATGYLLWHILEKQGGYFWLDSPPLTLPGKDHRPAYGSDGDFFSKPNRLQIVERVYNLLHEADPTRFQAWL